MNDFGTSPAMSQGLSQGFGAVVSSAAESAPVTKKKAGTSPFSIRFTQEERARLEAESGSHSLSAYIRSCVLGKAAQKRKSSPNPTIQDKDLARALAGLGQSRLASNMNQIARAANFGVIEVSPELIGDLEAACVQIREIRDALITALGIKAES